MGFKDIAIGQELLNVPMGDMIRNMAFAIADAQFELDESSIRSAELMSGQLPERNSDGDIVYREALTGALLFPKINEDGTIATDTTGETLYVTETGEAAKDAQPTFIDTRVFFGYEYVPVPNDTNNPPATVRRPNRVSMMELGFTPTFYQFIDTIIEVKIAIKITRDESLSLKAGFSTTSTTTSNEQRTAEQRQGLFRRSKRTSTGTVDRTTAVTATVDAEYSSKYSYSAEGSSLPRTKLVPVPPPAVLEERIRSMIEIEAKREAAALTGSSDGGGGTLGGGGGT